MKWRFYDSPPDRVDHDGWGDVDDIRNHDVQVVWDSLELVGNKGQADRTHG